MLSSVTQRARRVLVSYAPLRDRRPPRYPFDFSNAEKPYESYNGLNVRLRYFIRVTVTRGYPSGNLVKEQDFVVQRDGGVRSFVVPPRRRDARARHRRSRNRRARAAGSRSPRRR